MATLRIPARFNGPPSSGHGGYSAGLFASALGGDAAAVSLRAPPPLEHDLQVVEVAGGVEILDGETLVATVEPAVPVAEPPAPLSPEAAAASEVDPAELLPRHPFPSCYGCGPLREEGDGLRLFAGPVDGDPRTCAAAWTPREEVTPLLVWAALDCPSSGPVLAAVQHNTPVVLARFCVEVEGDVRAGEPHAVVSRAVHDEGRKHLTAVALFDAAGQRLARGEALWIALARP